jgi:hypothetical protein
VRARHARLFSRRRECVGGVLLELAQFVERRAFSSSCALGFAQLDDAHVPGARRRRCRGLIVELLLEGERLVELSLRTGQRRFELAGGLVAELRPGEPELLLARLDGVVRLDEGRGRAAREIFEAHRRGRG